MATYTVGASSDDVRMQGIANDAGRAVGTGAGISSITETTLSPGSHTLNDEWSIGARFTGVAVAQGATIAAATFSMKCRTTYASGGTIAFLVSAHAADNATTFSGAGGALNTTNRPRTTAVSAVWTQTSITAGTRYSIDVTGVVQELVNRAGWASGNAIAIIVDTDPSTTQGEWQDYYAWDDTADRTNNPPQLDITVGSSGGAAVLAASATLAAAGGYAEPTYVGAGAAAFSATSGATITPGLPTGWAADDIHVLLYACSDNTDLADPAGWTRITPSGVSEDNTTAQHVEVFWRRAVAGDTAPGLTRSGTIVRGAQIYGIRGCDTAGDPFAGSSRLNNAASATVATTSATPSQDHTRGLFLYAYEDDPSAASTPTGWGAFAVATSALGTDMALGVSTRAIAAAAAQNPSTTVSGGTFANSVNAGILLFLKPPGGAAVAGAAVLDTSGTVAAVGQVAVAGGAVLAGSATVAPLARVAVAGVAALAGSATLAADGLVTRNGAAALDASATVVAAGRVAVAGVGLLAGSATLAAGGVVAVAGVAALTGTATLAASAGGTIGGVAALDASATVAAAGRVAIAGVAALSGSATLAADGTLTIGGAAALGASGALAGAGRVAVAGVAALAATATLAAAGSVPGAGISLVSPGATLGGYTDVTPRQIVRTSGDRAYAVVMECDAYPFEAGDRLVVYRADQTGIPTSFTASIQAVTDASTVAIAIDGGDVIHIALQDRGGNLKYYKWTTATDTLDAGATVDTGLPTNLGQGEESVALTLDSSGIPHVVYLKSDGTNRRVLYRNRAGGSWSAAATIDDQGFGANQKCWHPGIITLASGSFLIAWERGAFNGDNDGTLFVRRRSAAGTNAATVNLSGTSAARTSIDQSLAMIQTADGRIHSAWITATNDYIRYSYSDDSGDTWSANNPGSGTRVTHNPAIAPGDNGGVRIYGHGSPASPPDGHGDDLYYFAGAGGGAAWGTWTLLTTGAYDSSVNVRWSQHFWNSANTADLLWWGDSYPNDLWYGGFALAGGAQAGAAALAGTATVAAAGQVAVAGVAALGGSATVAAVGRVAVAGVAALSTTGTLAAVGQVAVKGVGVLSTTATLAADGTVGGALAGAAVLPGAATLAASGQVAVAGGGALAGAATLAAVGRVAVSGAAALDTSATLAATGRVAVAGAAALAGGATLVATIGDAIPRPVGAWAGGARAGTWGAATRAGAWLGGRKGRWG